MEDKRHNVTTESHTQQQIEESRRHNIVTEGQQSNVLRETQRHNLASEHNDATRNLINQQNYQVINAETQRHNMAVEAETARHNLAQEQETARHNIVSESVIPYNNALTAAQTQTESQKPANVAAQTDKFKEETLTETSEQFRNYGTGTNSFSQAINTITPYAAAAGSAVAGAALSKVRTNVGKTKPTSTVSRTPKTTVPITTPRRGGSIMMFDTSFDDTMNPWDELLK